MELFKLVGKIFVDSSEAEKSISKTDKSASGLGDKLASGIKTAGKWAAGLGAAATAVGVAMVAAAKDTANTLDVIDKGAQRMKISAESYQELAHAAGLSGVEMSTLEKAAKKLEGKDLNLDQALDQIMSIGDESERTQKAIELFGDAVAYNMTPLLSAGADGLAEMRQEANDLGLVMSQQMVTDGAAMNDMFAKVESSVSALKNGLAQELMPYAMEILQWVLDNLPLIQQTVKSTMDTILPIVKPVLDGIMELLPPLLEKIKAFLDWITPYVEPVVRGVADLISGILSLIDGDVDSFAENVKSGLTSLATAFFGIGKDIFGKLLEGFKSAWSKIADWVSEKVAWIKSKFDFGGMIGNLLGSVNGSHASGLAYVPYDGYRAELHRGETVLTANTTNRIEDALDNLASALASGKLGGSTQAIYLNDGTLVGALSPQIDRNLGINYAVNARGALT